MALRTTILLFSLCVVLSYAQSGPPPGPDKEVFHGKGNMTLDVAYNFTLRATNFKKSATLTVSPPNVVVCLQEKYSIPAPSQFGPLYCSFFFNLTNTSGSQVLYLRDLKYHIGVYDAHKNLTINQNVTVEVTLTGDTCSSYQYGPNCNVSTPIDYNTNNNTNNTNQTTFWASFPDTPNEGWPRIQYFNLSLPKLVGSITIKPSPTSFMPEESPTVRIRYEGAPSEEAHDAKTKDGVGNQLLYVSPRPGLWVVSVEAYESGNYTFNVIVDDCSHSAGAGQSCTTHYENAEDNMTLVAGTKPQPRYWKVVVPAHTTMWVSVTTLNNTDLPFLYASKDNLPTTEKNKNQPQVDISNCNQKYCNVVRSILVSENASTTTTWFIEVDAIANTTYGLWFNSTCAPQCQTDNHGTCRDDGTCYCQIDFTGIDCTVSKGLGAQYIVLIIIAALVVASAVIGFVAWAYMRRKRVNYELVS